MKHVSLGGLDVSRIGLGAMTMAGTYTSGGGLDDAESIRTIHRALELGVTHIDTAEIYGPFHSEEIVGRAIKGRRDQVVVATKFGLVSHAGGGPGVIDSSPANIRAAVEGSLRGSAPTTSTCTTSTGSTRSTPIEDTVGALAELVTEGKVGHIGLSEASPATIRRAHAVHPVAALQTEYSLWTRDPEDELLPLLRELGIGFVPYSPLGHGFLTGQIRTADDIPDDDWRKANPRFIGENFHGTCGIVDEVRVRRRRSRRHPGPDRPGLAARPRRRHRPDPRHPARRPRRGEHRRRRPRAHRRPARAAERPHPGRGRTARRSQHGHHRPLISGMLGPRRPARPSVARIAADRCIPEPVSQVRTVLGAFDLVKGDSRVRRSSTDHPTQFSWPGAAWRQVGPAAEFVDLVHR